MVSMFTQVITLKASTDAAHSCVLNTNCFSFPSVLSFAVGIHSWSLLLLKATFTLCVGLVALHIYLVLTANKQQRAWKLMGIHKIHWKPTWLTIPEISSVSLMTLQHCTVLQSLHNPESINAACTCTWNTECTVLALWGPLHWFKIEKGFWVGRVEHCLSTSYSFLLSMFLHLLFLAAANNYKVTVSHL